MATPATLKPTSTTELKLIAEAKVDTMLKAGLANTLDEFQAWFAAQEVGVQSQAFGTVVMLFVREQNAGDASRLLHKALVKLARVGADIKSGSDDVEAHLQMLELCVDGTLDLSGMSAEARDSVPAFVAEGLTEGGNRPETLYRITAIWQAHPKGFAPFVDTVGRIVI